VASPHRALLPPLGRITCGACGSNFIPTPSSNREFSPTRHCVMDPRTTRPTGSRISGKEIITESRYASRQFGHGIRSAWGKSKAYAALFSYQRCIECASYQAFRREINGRKSISHSNVLPIIDLSETMFPFCIVSPWMPNGNIIQYANMNPDVDRLLLVRARQLEARRGITRDPVDNSLRKCALASCIFMGWVFYTVASLR
jgi:hypothetical protein